MSQWLNILQGGILIAAGAGLCYLLVSWRDRNLKKARLLEAQSIVDKARTQGELLLRDARLAGNEEARKLRDEVEQSFTARRTERAELEKRLSDREGLINSQLERVVEEEKTLTGQRAAFRLRTDALIEKEKELQAV